MSSEGKDPGAIWQGPLQPRRSQEQAHSIDQDDEPPVLPQEQIIATPPATTPPPVSEEDEPVDEDPIQEKATLPEMAKSLGKRAVPVLIPLFFAALTCLFVLPLIAENRASVTPDNLWLIVVTVGIVAIAQIIALFYAEGNNGLWALALVSGFCLFLLVGSFAIFGPIVGFLLLAALLALAALLSRYVFHPVAEGFVDIVFSFGKYSRTLYAGPNLLLPWEKVTRQLKVNEIQWLCPPQRVQLSRNEDVILRAAISYQLLPEDAHLAVTQVDQWENQLRELLITKVQTIATAFSPDDFISWPEGLHTPPSASDNADSLERRERVNSYLYREISEKAAPWGVIIHWVNIRDVMLAPHDAVIDTDKLLAAPPQAQPPAPPQVMTQPDVTTPAKAQLAAQKQPPAQKAANVPKASEQSFAAEHPERPAPPKILNEEVLTKAYKEVQDGKVTDPYTIREIAARFQAIASDPQASAMVSFDAERAALNLYEQADKYERSRSVAKQQS